MDSGGSYIGRDKIKKATRSVSSWGVAEKVGQKSVSSMSASMAFQQAFFAAMLIVFLSTLNDPNAKASEGPVGPKLIQFLADNELEVAPGLTWVNSDMSSSQAFHEKTEDYMKNLNMIANDKSREPCSEDDEGYEGETQCRFDMNTTNVQCQNTTSFGYNSTMPCLFVKMNKVWRWVPMADEENPKVLKLECKAEGAKEVNVINGGFQKSAFPFKGQKDFMTPPVAVQVTLETDPDVKEKKMTKPVTVKCELKGKGIVPSESFVASRAYGKVQMKVPALAIQQLSLKLCSCSHSLMIGKYLYKRIRRFCAIDIVCLLNVRYICKLYAFTTVCVF